MINFWKFKSANPFMVNYAYIDANEYLADNLFIKYKVKVHFGSEYQEPNTSFRIIRCKIRRGKEKPFEEALRELPNKAAIMGYPNYMEYCVGLMVRMEDVKNAA